MKNDNYKDVKNNKKDNLEIDLFVLRVKKDGSVGMAKPCSHCARVLRETNIRYIYYSTDKYIKRELAKTLQNDHLCASAKRQLALSRYIL